MTRLQWAVALSVAAGWIVCALWLSLEVRWAERRARRSARRLEGR